MRVLLDECVPAQLVSSLLGHEVRTAGRLGWAGKKNGDLLRLAAAQFDGFLTVDRGLTHQHRISGFEIGVVVLVAYSNDFEVLRPLMPRVRQAIRKVKPGQVIRISA